MAEIEYRHPLISDVEAITGVFNRSSRELPLHRDETVEEVREFSFKEDDYDNKGFLLAIIDGQAAGYGGSHVYDSRIKAGKNDASITIAVIPEHRGKGIEQHFMEFALEYLRSRGVGTAMRWAFGMEGWRHDISTEFGFKDVRHNYIMVWKGDKAPEVIPLPDGVILESIMLKDAGDDVIAQFVGSFNESFADHYNFAPTPVKQFIKWREIDDEICRLTFAKEGQDVVGVCMCEESALYNKQNNTNIGWADILGVKKLHRKRGIGRALLSEGMRWIHDTGKDTIYLGMDAENRTALGLYTSLGFKVHTESVTYKKSLE